MLRSRRQGFSDAANLAREAQLENLLTKIGEAAAFVVPEIQAIDDVRFESYLGDPVLSEWSNRLDNSGD